MFNNLNNQCLWSYNSNFIIDIVIFWNIIVGLYLLIHIFIKVYTYSGTYTPSEIFGKGTKEWIGKLPNYKEW